jgi:hypothetical protein
MVFGIIPECRSDSSRIQRSASPESPVMRAIGKNRLLLAENSGKMSIVTFEGLGMQNA